MNLRLKLLLIFVAASLSALTFFGYIAYDTAKVASIKNETALLSSFARRIADDSSRDLVAGSSWSVPLVSDGDEETGNRIFLIITDQNGSAVNLPDNSDFKNAYEILRQFVPNAKSGQSGSFVSGDKTYMWASEAAQLQGFRATFLTSRHVSSANSFFREMGVTLIFGGFVLLWFASWGAMYIAGLFERLDEQKNILRHRALHDALTGLPNRALLNDRMRQIIQVAERTPAQAALCFIDLNRFKEVNDSLGHAVGDELLLEISRRLKGHLRKSDTVARIGGDEFALILRNVDDATAMAVLEKLVQEIEAPVELRQEKLFVSGSVGVALFPADGDSVESLMQRADVAMYAAKRSGSRIAFYSSDLEVFSRDKLALTHDLRDAIAGSQLELHYQPKYHIGEKRVIGAEALLRWSHPIHGPIPPPTFIQIAEHAGLIRGLTKWVLQRAFSDWSRFARQGRKLNLSVNLSAHNLQDPELESTLYELLSQCGIGAQEVTLELTESAVVQNLSQTKQLLVRLHERGFRISVDDFGTGYSTLTNLRRLPISEIKIDRSFVSNMKHDPEDASIVRATIELGKALGIDVVAEGVETQEVLDQLDSFGCRSIQGYFISKPMPLGIFENWLGTSTPAGTVSQPVENLAG